MYNKTIVDWLTETKDIVLNLSRFRMLDICASVLFLVLISGGRKLWLNVLSFVLFLEGITNIIYPKSMEFWVTGELDEVHIMLIRGVGMLCVTWTLIYFLIGKSTDSTTETSFLLSCSVSLLSNLLAKGYLLTHLQKASASPRIEYESMTTIFYVTLLFTVGTLFHTFKSSDWGGYGEQASHANFHLRVQFVIFLLMGVISYAMPQWTVKMMVQGDVGKLDAVHGFISRGNGTFLLAMAMLSNRAANFLRKNDKDAVVFCQWLCFVMCTVFGWIDAAGKWSDLEWSRIVLQALFDAVLVLNATGALNRDFSVIKVVVIPRFKMIPQDIRGLFKFKRM